MSHYKPYPAYKDSGVEWLGQVPEGWESKKIKWEITAKSGTDEKVDGGNYELFGANGIIGLTSTLTVYYPTVLIGRVGSAGSITFVDGEYGVSDNALVITNRRYDTPRFDFYLFQSMDLAADVSKNAQPLITASDIRDRIVTVPKCHQERLVIVAHLDRETARIDGLVSRKTRFIELLREKRQALITHAVTKGLNPDAPMKDSGVEWLGDVPEHWDVCKLSFRYSVELGKMLDEKRITGESLVPYLRNQDVQWNSINIEGLPEMDIHLGEIERYTIKRGDLLVCEGGDVGRAAIWRGSNLQIGYQKALHRLRARSDKRDTAEFFYFSLLAAKERGVFDESDAKATIAHLPAEKFRQYRFAFPPLSEQIKIAAYIQANNLRIDTLISKTERSIELLKERRSALITAAVTGQIDLRETI